MLQDKIKLIIFNLYVGTLQNGDHYADTIRESDRNNPSNNTLIIHSVQRVSMYYFKNKKPLNNDFLFFCSNPPKG